MTVILWMGEVEKEKPVMREFRSEENLRIIAVADVVESMSSHRPYRPALGTDSALEEISRNKGKLYDPEVVDICIRLFKEEGFKLEE